MRIAIPVASLVLSSLCACGSSSSGSDDGGGAGDTGVVDGGDAGTDSGVDTGTAADGGGDAATDECPTYQERCEGVCIPVVVDPDNCGGCGVICEADAACSAGSCETECLSGQTICDRSCVDVMTDNRHCGDCGAPCGDGEGCVEGECQAGAIGGETHAACEGGGPPIEIDVDGESECAGAVATTTFRWALCSCMDAQLSNALLTDAYDSSDGPYTPGGRGGGVGLNGDYSSSSTADIGGALWASSTDGITTSNDLTVRLELHSGGPMTTQTTVVETDAYVDGDVTTPASIEIMGDLHQSPGSMVTGDVTYASRIEEPVSVPPPCDCDPSQLIPVADIVAAHASTNDNARIDLDPAELDGPDGPRRIDLPCGHYYLDAIRSSRPIAIVAHGHTALYIGGDAQVSNALRITVDPDGTLDVFIAGRFGGSGSMSIGSPNYPALTRFYIGSDDGWTVSSDSLFGAFFYAPYGPVVSSAPLEVFGGVFAGDFRSSSRVTVHYDRAVLRAGQDCDTPTGGGVCDSCRDCNNQACMDGACGSCTDSSQCCAPLVCRDGACVTELI